MRTIAIDTETRLIEYPDQVNPDMVCLTYAYEGWSGIIHAMEYNKMRHFLLDLFSTDHEIVGHNIAFDLHVILKKFPELWPKVWTCLRLGLVYDTMLRQRLYLLSTLGDVQAKPTSLADLIKLYLNKDITASKGADAWRMRYAELMQVPLEDWPKEASEYAITDAEYTLAVYNHQDHIIAKEGPGSAGTQSTQVCSAFALRGMEINGIRINKQEVTDLSAKIVNQMVPLHAKLTRAGILRENGKKNTKILQRYAAKWGVTDMTAKGKVSTSMKSLKQLNAKGVVYKTYMEYASIQKAATTFLPQMMFDRIHPRYNPLVNTGRTSCFSSKYYKTGEGAPSINLQQIPRDERFRKVFMPEEGMLFVCADYSNLELICAAQNYRNLVGYSKMGNVLNTGENLHTYLGATIYNDIFGTSISLDAFKNLLSIGDKRAKMARQSAKPVNLGCPGGQSATTIQRTAQETYGMPVTIEQAIKWKELAMDQYTEISEFFLTILPTARVGTMPLKTVNGVEFVARYDASVNGIYRAKMTYCAAANSICMQMTGALGKKLALIEAYERCTNSERQSDMYGSVMHIDMHDEILLSTPRQKMYSVEKELAECMIGQMQKVCPDMRIATESMIMRRWGKDAEAEFKAIEFSIDEDRSRERRDMDATAERVKENITKA